MGCGWVRLRGEGDGVAECFELADEVAGFLVGVDAAGVVAGAEVVVAGGGVGEQVPDDDQDGAGDGDEGLELAAAVDEAPVAFAEEGVGLGGGGGGLTEDALEVGVALAGFAGAAAGPDWMVRGQSFAQDTRWPAVGNRVMSSPISAMMTCAACGADPGDLVEPREAAGARPRPGRCRAGPVVPSA